MWFALYLWNGFFWKTQKLHIKVGKEERCEPKHSAWKELCCGFISERSLLLHHSTYPLAYCGSGENWQCFWVLWVGEKNNVLLSCSPRSSEESSYTRNCWIMLLTSGFGAACWWTSAESSVWSTGISCSQRNPTRISELALHTFSSC